MNRVIAEATNTREENARLRNQVSISNVKAVEDARAAKNEADYRASCARDAAKAAQENAERANRRADEAEKVAKRKYDDIALDNRHKYQFLGWYATLSTFLYFITSARCRSDTSKFVDFIGMIVGGIFNWEVSMFSDGILYIIFSLICMIVIPIFFIVGFVLLGIAYKKVCIDSFMDTEGARFRTEIVGLCSIIIPIYLISYMPEQMANLWGTTMLIQAGYFIICLLLKS